MTWLAVLGIGVVVGFLGGLFGKGGSAIATPLLHAAGVPAYVAIAAPLPATVPGTVVAALAYTRAGLVDRRVVTWSVAAGVPATVLGAYATRWIPGEPIVLATEVVIALIGIWLLLRPGARRDVPGRPAGRLTLTRVALVAGLVAGLLASSGGFVLVPLYLAVARLRVRAAFACSLVVSAALALPGTIVHAALGHLDWAVVGVFAAGLVPLSYVGARVALRTRADRLERLYGALLVTVAACTLVT